jgi:molybdopterin molybdotransferase
MDQFFKVTHLDDVMGQRAGFGRVGVETIPLGETNGRVLADDVTADLDLPGFSRSTMDGFAVPAASTFGASEANPAYLEIVGAVAMGETPPFSVSAGQAVRIATGGMLPPGADAVVMVEHTDILDETTIEVYKSVAPGQHMIAAGEDFPCGETVLGAGIRIRPQETGLMAAFGKEAVHVFRRPRVGIISTGDEVVPVSDVPGPGRIRDINSHSLSGLVAASGGIPKTYGIIKDNFDSLRDACCRALEETDTVMISGGSSVGVRDFTVGVLGSMPESEILVHGISISPGKPTILARAAGKAVWGLPGHVVSAMVVYSVVVRPFIESLAGLSGPDRFRLKVPARLSRNVSAAQGRIDFIRVRLHRSEGTLRADPVLGKSGLINTMVRADGLIEVDMNTEGLDSGAMVDVMLI